MTNLYRIIPYLIVVALSVLHLCQGIVFSGGKEIPGDLGDARLVNLILEHNWQSFIGNQNLISPSQFYPKQHTIFYSHNLWGVTPLYGIFRMLGMSVESSYQTWFILVCTLNSICFLFLLRKLKINTFIAVPLTLVGVASGALVYKTGHPQLLSIFPFFLSLSFLLTFLREFKLSSFVLFVLFYVYQHYCSIYQGFFATLIILSFVSFYCFFCWTKTIDLIAYINEKKRYISITIISALLLLFILYFPYYLISKIHGTRNIDELRSLAPELGSWFSANPYSFFYSNLNFISLERNAVWENWFFSGFTGYIVSGVFLVYFFLKKPKLNWGTSVALCLVFSHSFLFFLVSNFIGSEFNLWVWLAEYIKPLRAIRAFGRIFILLTSIQVISTAIILNYLIKKYGDIKFAKSIILIVPLILVFESLSIGQTTYLKKEAQGRALGLVENFKASKDIEAFIYAPGVVTSPWVSHLDAWNVSLIKGIPCLNGYSGHSPKTHVKFLSSPTKENALELIQRRGFNDQKIGIFETRSPQYEKKYPLIRYDLSKVKIKTEVENLEGFCDQEIFMDCEISNLSKIDIPASRLSFYPSYRFYNTNGDLLDEIEPLRTPVEVLFSDKTIKHKLKINMPKNVGDYLLKVSFVKENVEWKVDNLPKEEVSTVRVKVVNQKRG